MRTDAPIGVFDSGLGGLTVFRALRQALPQESLLYVGDTARVPYGNKSPDTITRYAREILDFLAHREVKAVVVACNTASALAVPTLVSHYSFPVFGMIEPGVARAIEMSRRQRIGVIGTAATVASQAYERRLTTLCPTAFVTSQACPLFVPLVEEGWINTSVTAEIARHYLDPLKSQGIDTIILGCTHYPILQQVIQRVMGADVALVDSGAAAAVALRTLLAEQRLLVDGAHEPRHQLYVTDALNQFSQLAQLVVKESLPPIETIQL